MARQDTLEESKGIFEEGVEYKFQIKEIGDRVETTKSHYRKWTFTTFIDGNSHEITINFFPFQAIPLLEMMGFKKVDGKMSVDYDVVEGRTINAKVFNREYEKKDGSGKGKAYDLKDFRYVANENDEIPF